MKFDFNKPALDLDGNVINENGSPAVLGRILARRLVNVTNGDSLRLYDWAKDMYALKSIDLSRSDVKLLQDFVERDTELTNLSKAQLLIIINEKVVD